MLKKTVLFISSISIFALSACSNETPIITEKLRKIGAPIQGDWQVADFEKCMPEKKGRNIKITKEEIQLSNTKTEKTITLLKDMKQLESTKFIILKGKLNLYETNGKRILAYSDEGDKLVFKGFLANNKLIKRQVLLEKYNANGNAKRNVETLDFNFCSAS